MRRPGAVVVVAASAGGLYPLRRIAAGLKADFPAPILIANHSPPTRETLLPMILATEGPLPATCARDQQRLEAGRIVVAKPGRHLLVAHGGTVRVTRAAMRNFLRPSADVLFESAARTFGRRAIGIVLSGGGDDGAAGLAAIHAAGGITIVQSPKDAKVSSMPANALARVKPDACVPADAIATLLERLVRTRLHERNTSRARQEPRSRRKRWSLRGLRVLVAEDRSLPASEIVGMLRKVGSIAVGPVADLASGQTLLAKRGDNVDCAVLDVDLRGRTVFPLALALRERGIPVVFATASGGAPLPKHWLSCQRLQKPFTSKQLAAALRNARGRQPAVTAFAPYSSENLNELRRLLVISRAWIRSEAGRMDRETVNQMNSATRSVLSSRKALEASRVILKEADAVLAESKSRRKSARSTMRAWHRGKAGS